MGVPRVRDTDVAGNGAHKIRSWVAVAAAAFPTHASVLAYEPIAEWITGMGVVEFPLNQVESG